MAIQIGYIADSLYLFYVPLHLKPQVLRGETMSGRYRCNGSAGSQEVTLAVIAPVVLPPNGAELGLRFFLRWH